MLWSFSPAAGPDSERHERLGFRQFASLRAHWVTPSVLGVPILFLDASTSAAARRCFSAHGSSRSARPLVFLGFAQFRSNPCVQISSNEGLYFVSSWTSDFEI
jgi:hypothetical protein